MSKKKRKKKENFIILIKLDKQRLPVVKGEMRKER